MSSRTTYGKNTPLIIALIVVLMISFVAIAVLSSMVSSDDSSSRSSAATQESTETNVGLSLINLEGQWTADNNGSKFVADVANSNISIKLVNGNTSAVYWNGTFASAESAGATIVSDKVETGKLVLSRATSKSFIVKADTLSFEFEAMGMTTTVALKRV
jgi:hypothetical protein